MRCQRCAAEQFVKAGVDRARRQLHRCPSCGRRQTARSASAFCGYRFPTDSIALAVRWYVRFRLPSAAVADLVAERGVHVDPSTVFDGVQQVTPLYKEAARPHRRRVGRHWSSDETSIRSAGAWCYAVRAIDETGPVIDVYVSPTRDTAAATTFLERAAERADVMPDRATTDTAPISPPVLPQAAHVSGTMEQQRSERDHHHLKGRTRCLRGFPTLPCAPIVCDGHGFRRNLRDGLDDVAVPVGDPRIPQAARLVRVGDAVTTVLAAA